MKMRSGRWLAAGAGAALALGLLGGASQATPLRVGKPQGEVFSFVPLDVGIEEGIFKKHGVDVAEIDLGGAAKLQQALAAQAIDIGLGSGPALAFIAKGAPQLGIAAMAGPPLVMTLIVAKDGPIKTVADLKGKTVSISSPGGVPEWMVRELSRRQGWGPDGIKMIGLGSDSAQVAAMRTNQVVGMPNDIGVAEKLEDEGIARILVRFGDIVPTFIMHVIFAGDDVIQKRPDDLRRFLAGWFDTIAYMRAHKADVVRIGAQVTHVSPAIESRVYDAVMPMFSSTGRFDPKATAILARSFVELKLLPTEPDMTKLYTEKFLPATAAK
ncbi:MAG TPA: ABC transporter substrate-binding protein [Stellaceae bacterium]|nr:ABC transporter substrate-binding protein [Stellaceae bacterium]